MQKRLLDPTRVRQVPRQFSWVDQRLVRERRLYGLGAESWALYLFLITVADAQGLSYYGDTSICHHLALSAPQLAKARQVLIDAQLLAYVPPLYQVLTLDQPAPTTSAVPVRSSSGHTRGLQTMREILHRLGEQA